MLDDVVALLERQYTLVAKQGQYEFFAPWYAFIGFLNTEPRIAVHLDDMRDEHARRCASDRQRRNALRDELVAIRGHVAAVLREGEDDSHLVEIAGNEGRLDYRFSLAYFDANVIVDNPPPSFLGQLVAVLDEKVKENGDADASRDRLCVFSGKLEHALRDENWWTLTSPLNALAEIDKLFGGLNPDPRSSEFDEANSFELVLRRTLARLGDAHQVHEATIGAGAGDGFVGVYGRQRTFLERVYEELRRRIGTVRSHRALVARFKTRAEWYERDELRELAARSKTPEDTLTARLARFLFDSGLNPITKPLMGHLQPDLHDPHSAFYVEAKQYGGASPKTYVVKGARQVWDTVGALRGTPYELHEAHYVVFRRGGPRVSFRDREVRAEGLVLYPVLIDIAPISETGSRQKQQPVEITGDDLAPKR